MNDEFLHRLRQPPPAAFAARLRARLESLAVARSFRGRQVTLYALIACLLGSTALALVVPTVRETAQTLLREVWLPGKLQPLAAPPAQPLAGMGPAPQSLAQPPAVRTQVDAGSKAVLDTQTRMADAHASVAPPVYNYASAGGFGATPSSAQLAMKQLTLAGAAATQAAASGAIDEFRDLHRDVIVNYEIASSQRALLKLCDNEIDVALTTRLISPIELEHCRNNGIAVIALPLAYETLAVIANSANDWVEMLERTELKLLFANNSQAGALSWNQLDSRWPSLAVESFVPRSGIDFGDTFDELILGASLQRRRDASTSSAQEVSRLMQTASRTLGGIAYVPYAYYLDLEQKFQPAPKLVKIVNDDSVAVLPSHASIGDGSYPLARVLLLFAKRGNLRSRVADQFLELASRTTQRSLMRSAYLPLASEDTELAIRVLTTNKFAEFEPRGLRSLSARAILLQQLPEDQRQQQFQLDSKLRGDLQ